MPPSDAAAFAEARPEIAAGVVIGTPAMLGQAAEAVGAAELDTAIWVGSVTNTHAALIARERPDGQDGTCAEILLPHPGTFDRDAATAMVAAATQTAEDAHCRQQAAALQASNAREVLAALNQLWTDLPTDPRPSLEDKIYTARTRNRRPRPRPGPRTASSPA